MYKKTILDLLDERFHEAGSVLVRQYWSLTIGEVFPTGSQFAGVTMRELVDLVVKEIAELNRIGLAIIPGIMGVLKNEQYKRLLERGAPPVQKVVAVLITESKGGYHAGVKPHFASTKDRRHEKFNRRQFPRR